MKTLSIIAILSVGAGALPAQESAGRYNGHGYGYFGIGGANGTNAMLNYGFGADILTYKGLGAGFDLGYLHPRECPTCGIGLLSVNPSYHFVNRNSPGRVVPFVTAGYGLGFRQGSQNLWNWGGGATIWLRDRIGLRLEVRDYRDRQYQFTTQFRVGFAFR